MKRKVPVSAARAILAKVPFQYSFWLCTNENLRSIEDVSKALEKASDDVFRYHVNRDKNDFEVWIRDIVKDKDLAREIARVKTKETLVRKITERIEGLRSIIKRNGPKKRVQKAKTKRKPKRRRVKRSARHRPRRHRHVRSRRRGKRRKQ